MKKKFLSLILICFSIFILVGCTNPFSDNHQSFSQSIYTQPTTVESTDSMEDRVKKIGEDYVDAVVTIFILDSLGDEISFGSGVGIFEGGYIVTNYHVVSNVVESTGYSLKVYYNEDETGYDAEVLWSHYNLDLAVIKSENANLPFVEMADRFIEPLENNALYALEPVVAIGTPIDFSLQNTVTLGYISSATHRISVADDNVYEDLIQHTSPINHGNSGGALFDTYGKLIGLNTLGNDNANSLFFAIPIYPVMLVIDKIVDADENSTVYATPKLEINAVDSIQALYILEQEFDEDGMLVTNVPEGASFGKLLANDIIKSMTVDEETFEIVNRNDLIFALLHAESGDSISIGFKRSGLSYSVNITLA